jgi:predicted acylesterase/phospholipase RssA
VSGELERGHAVVLSGGGGYAAYEIGVLRALCSGDCPVTNFRPIEPDVVTGTSAGAFNAALFCSLPPRASALAALEYVEDVWLRGVAGSDGCGNNVLRFRANPLTGTGVRCADTRRTAAEWSEDVEVLSAELAARADAFARSTSDLQQRVLEWFDAGLLLASDRFVALVAETVEAQNVRRSRRRVRIAATNWRTGELRIFANADMTDAIAHRVVLASTATPGMFPTIEIEGEPYADGAAVMNTPLAPAIDAGAHTLHVIYMDPHADNVPLARLRSTSSTLYRLYVIAQASMMNRDIEIARRVNIGIDVLEGRAAPEASEDAAKGHHLLAARARGSARPAPYRRIAIHRYHPHEDPGGPLRWLSFGRDQIERLIVRGYEDAAAHACDEHHCLVARG